ncbi:hypothetical protein GP486_003738, partial [Trichoglossum hirsutum]
MLKHTVETCGLTYSAPVEAYIRGSIWNPALCSPETLRIWLTGKEKAAAEAAPAVAVVVGMRTAGTVTTFEAVVTTTGFDKDMEVALLGVVIAQWDCKEGISEAVIRLTAWEVEYAAMGAAEVADADAVTEDDAAAEATGSETTGGAIRDWVWA